MKPGTRSFYETAVRSAVEQVTRDLDGALDLQALARGAALSPFHFHRVFRGAMGETPLEMQRRLRLERAAWSLRHDSKAVTTIAFAAGYETHESFTRAFRGHYDCSPTEFRQCAADGATCARPYQIELPCRSGIHFRTAGYEFSNLHFLQGDSSMNVDIKQMDELRVATVTHKGPYNQISEAFARLGEIAGASGLITQASAMLGIYYDDPETTPPAELRSEAALVVPPNAAIPAGLGERRLPAGAYAHTVHIGSYEKLADTWARFMGEWLPRSGHRMSDGVSYEIYLNTPENAPPEQLRTELYLPLAPSIER
jgi:AraC family transcriptional regulator